MILTEVVQMLPKLEMILTAVVYMLTQFEKLLIYIEKVQKEDFL